ncbi:WD40 repeat-like protein [Serendipita vermifera]|nr:WD40 repeat-like protein [Serendipita vermifera]
MVASGGDESHPVCCWNGVTGHLLAVFPKQHQGWVTDVAFVLGNEYVVSGSRDCTVRMWPTTGTGVIRVVKADVMGGSLQHTASVEQLAVSPERKVFASRSSESVIVLIAERCTSVSIVREGGCTDMLFSVDGKILIAACANGDISLYNAASCESIGVPQGHTGEICSMTLSPDGSTLVSAAKDESIRFWSLRTKKEQCKPMKSQVGITCSLQFTDKGRRLVSGGYDRAVHVWDVKPRGVGVKGDSAVLAGHTNTVTRVAVSPDSKTIASLSPDRSLRLWRIGDADRDAHAQERTRGEVWQVLFSRDGTRLVSAERGSGGIQLWDATTGARLGQILHYTDQQVGPLVFSNQPGLFASDYEDGTV